MQSLTDILITRGWLTPAAAEDLPSRLLSGETPQAALVRLGLCTEERVMRAVADQWMLPFVSLEGITIPGDLIERVAADRAAKRLVKDRLLLPFAYARTTITSAMAQSSGSAAANPASVSQTVRVATADPGDQTAIDELARRLRVKVLPVVAPRAMVEKLIRETYGIGDAEVDPDEANRTAAAGADSDDVRDAQDSAVVRLVREVLEYAVRSRASDIHIESYEKKLRVRFRIDGVLHDAPMPEGVHKRDKAIVARLKILAGLKTDEKRLPQDGRIKQIIGGRPIDFRVSIIPMLWGEGVVLRILDQGAVMLGLQDLGMAERDKVLFRRVIDLPHGIFLVTGPTGSGKTTTLYTALNTINSEDIKIITAEDPIEYQLVGICQIEVKHKIGLSFAECLRRILRHDPDVVLVGEIRDAETAEVATQASLTGHLVLSTLHTNDAPSAMTRLVDMGLEPYLAASTVEAILAQRLVRVLCRQCRVEYDPAGDVLPPDLAALRPRALWRPGKCNTCGNTGYRGRKGIFELMPMDDHLREMVIAKQSAQALKKHALAHLGMHTLRQDAIEKVVNGMTTIDEISRVTREDEITFADMPSTVDLPPHLPA